VPSSVPLEYITHCLVIPVRVCGIEAKFVLDTGIGPNLISEDLAAHVGCHPDGSALTGRRMSGQGVTIPLGLLESLQIGASQLRDVQAGIFDMHAMAGLGEVRGFVSLTSFRTTPVTIDYLAGLLIVEDEASLARRAAAGTSVAVHVGYDRCSTTAMLSMNLPGGQPVSVEVDTGSDMLILNQSLAAATGIDLDGQDVQTKKGTDETGHEFTRYFTELRGDVTVSGAPLIRMTNPQVMFQEIIYDGLVGHRFLRNFTTTYDLANSRMIFAPPAPADLR
jgi:predicted aspartyl protease